MMESVRVWSDTELSLETRVLILLRFVDSSVSIFGGACFVLVVMSIIRFRSLIWGFLGSCWLSLTRWC